ncbi:MAG: HAD-IB family phosphatase [Chloroflexi bacterium]|nr:HAD-IB family phosphatase [Chloroflexota bacterium]
MPIRLVIFDVDGVIKVEHDPYTLLHRHFGTEEAGARYLADFMAERITYDEFAQLDAGEWQGRSLAETKDVLRANPYVPGAHLMALDLHNRKIPFILLSSGFDLHVEDVAFDLNASHYLCNDLHHDGEHLSGSMTVRVPWGGKAPIVREILEQRDIEPDQCMAVGDSTADIPAFQQVGYAVAVRPHKPEVSQAAQLTLPDLTGIIPFIDSID